MLLSQLWSKAHPKLNTENVKIKRALISVFDKTNLAMLGKELSSRGIEILSTGGSANFLREKNIPVTDVSDYTNFPEIMDGRVKTINPLLRLPKEEKDKLITLTPEEYIGIAPKLIDIKYCRGSNFSWDFFLFQYSPTYIRPNV